MKTLNYTKDIITSDLQINIQYNETLPTFILDVLTKAFNLEMGVYQYLEYKNIDCQSRIGKIILACFKGYEDLTSDYAEIQDTVKSVLKNGYITRSKILEGQIKSYQPDFDLIVAAINSQTFKLQSKEEISEKAADIAKQLYPSATNIVIDEIVEQNEKTEKEVLELKFDKDNITIHNAPISLSSDHISKIIEENSLFPDVVNYKNSELTNESDFFDAERCEGLSEWYRIQEGEEEINFTKIKEGSIEWTSVRSWNNLPVYMNTVIREGAFEKDSLPYKGIFKLFINKNITLNSFIYKAFFLQEVEVRNKIINDPSSLSRIVKDKKLLTKILLHDEEFKLDSVDLPKKHLIDILISASNNQLPKMLSKIPSDVKDTLMDAKLLNKISNVNPSLLSPVQEKFIADKEEKQKALNEEYISIIGKITTSGVREKIKKLTSKDKKKFGINKNFVKWMNEIIGHNKGQNNITQEELKVARTNWQKAQLVIKNKNK